jgi:hypothetical protein
MATPLDRNLFGAAYAGAGRRLSNQPVVVTAEEAAALGGVGLPPLSGWTQDEVGRVALLLRAMECLPVEEHVAFINDTYRCGDSGERRALLRALSFLPHPDRFLATAVEACRTNEQTVFEAIACDNDYPSCCFPDLSFNQMVLKALFTGVPLGRIVGLAGRVTLELRRMAEDYARELQAAGRPVPGDIALIRASG